MAWPFLEPVDPEDAPDYYGVIKEPMGKKLAASSCMLKENFRPKCVQSVQTWQYAKFCLYSSDVDNVTRQIREACRT